MLLLSAKRLSNDRLTCICAFADAHSSGKVGTKAFTTALDYTIKKETMSALKQ